MLYSGLFWRIVTFAGEINSEFLSLLTSLIVVYLWAFVCRCRAGCKPVRVEKRGGCCACSWPHFSSCIFIVLVIPVLPESTLEKKVPSCPFSFFTPCPHLLFTTSSSMRDERTFPYFSSEVVFFLLLSCPRQMHSASLLGKLLRRMKRSNLEIRRRSFNFRGKKKPSPPKVVLMVGKLTNYVSEGKSRSLRLHN